MKNTQDIPSTILALERAALDRWIRGDPGGFLEICAPDVVYFDPYREKRVDGLPALTGLYETLWGKVLLDRYELLNPLVQRLGDGGAVLTFNFVSYGSDGSEAHWDSTEVYRKDRAGWRIVQTHWSFTKR